MTHGIHFYLGFVLLLRRKVQGQKYKKKALRYRCSFKVKEVPKGYLFPIAISVFLQLNYLNICNRRNLNHLGEMIPPSQSTFLELSRIYINFKNQCSISLPTIYLLYLLLTSHIQHSCSLQ